MLIAHDSLIRKDNVTGIITTVAGSLAATSISDGIPATSALIAEMLAEINPIAIGNSGDLYFAFGTKIFKVPAFTGIVSTYAGTGLPGDSGDGGLAISATFVGIESICIDTIRGYLYVASSFNNRVRKINLSTGIISACAGTGTSGYSGDGGPAVAAKLNSPMGLCTDKFGNLYIGEFYTIRKVDVITGIITTAAGAGPGSGSPPIVDGGLATSGTLYNVLGISIDTCGNIYFIHANRVMKVDGICYHKRAYRNIHQAGGSRFNNSKGYFHLGGML